MHTIIKIKQVQELDCAVVLEASSFESEEHADLVTFLVDNHDKLTPEKGVLLKGDIPWLARCFLVANITAEFIAVHAPHEGDYVVVASESTLFEVGEYLDEKTLDGLYKIKQMEFWAMVEGS